MSELAHEGEVGPHIGDCVLHGMAWIYPECQGRMPRASRSLLGWHKLHVHGEGQGLPIEILVLVEKEMREAGAC